MNPTRYEPERHNVAMVAHPEGRFIFYLDAKKWVREEVAKKDEEIRRLSARIQKDSRPCPPCEHLDEKIKEIAGLKAELKEQFEQGISIIHDQGAENVLLKEQIAKLKSLVDGTTDIVETWPAESLGQKGWKIGWLNEAREALK